MVRSAALILVSALALAACNPNAPSGGGTASNSAAPSASGGFPNLSNASYRAEGTMNPGNSQPIPVVMVRSGQKSRMEMNRPEGQMVMISDLETHDAYQIVSRGGRTLMAMHMDLSGTEAANPTARWQGQTSGVTRTGPCSAAGESGTSWTRMPQPDEQVAGQPAKPMSACVTSDGILLWTKSGDDITWQTTRVTRGPQDPAQFTVPAGVHVQEMGNLAAQAAAMAARARAAQNGH